MYHSNYDKHKPTYSQFSGLRSKTMFLKKANRQSGETAYWKVFCFGFICRRRYQPTGAGASFGSSGPVGLVPMNGISVLLYSVIYPVRIGCIFSVIVYGWSHSGTCRSLFPLFQPYRQQWMTRNCTSSVCHRSPGAGNPVSKSGYGPYFQHISGACTPFRYPICRHFKNADI